MNAKFFSLIPIIIASAALAADPKPATPTAAKAKPPAPTYLTPEAGGQAYKDQGEYKNDWGGAQVIALGDDKFRMVTFKGGLPGEAWDKETKQEINGKREGEKIVFTGTNNYRAELANERITINTDAGGPWTMEKTVRRSPTEGAKSPAGAIVLFGEDKNVDAWKNGHTDERGLLASGTSTKQQFTNYKLHCEFLLPFKPMGRGQDRGNSGVYMQDRYEVQVLDSFGLKGEDNECGGIYTLAKPSLNMCYPPLTWQTYDIDFTAAKFDDSGKKSANARITVKHNGVVIHDNIEISKPTGGGKKEDAKGGSIQLQGHGNPVFYRNVWIVPKG
ncbi:MAG TPA: DUF1080 domain-containing protein [Candidatus Acidoferrum sp.]|nr:DUF1080 domain-containing protein [Candidatus Acidoferrum sp.]